MAALEREIGQMIMVGLSGEKLTPEEQRLIRSHRFGGFILFRHNCLEAAQIVSLCRTLWQTASDLPPFIAIDQEGGNVHRLPKPFTHFPAAAAIGRRHDPKLAFEAGQASALELAMAGINLNFAPVLDVQSNPHHPIIGDRAFSSEPEEAAQLGLSWAQGLRAGGVVPCGKHFPGHGGTDKDSHVDLPVVDHSLQALYATELVPFAKACQNRLESLMTAHVIFRALDPKFPATLSQKIITQILRLQLGHSGVVFSDDMEMAAISQNYDDAEAVELGVRGGIDVLLYGHELPKAIAAFEGLCSLSESDPTIRAQVKASYRRIAKLKKQRLKSFSGVKEHELATQLARLGHKRNFEPTHGSL